MVDNLLIVFKVLLQWIIVASPYILLSFVGLLIILYICKKYIKGNVSRLEVK